MEKNKTIDIEYTLGEVEKVIEKLITRKHQHHIEIANCITEELSKTDAGLKNLLLATQGVRTQVSDYGFKIGDLVAVEISWLSEWRMDKAAMEKAQLILNKTIECIIKTFDRTNRYPIHLQYKIINTDGDTITEDIWLSPKHIKKSML